MSAAHVAASERARLADQLVEIENSAKRRDREARRLPLDRRIAYFRLRELERIYARRYGLVLPDDEAGRGDLSIALNHIVFRSGDVLAKMLGWARRWAPWLPEAEARRIAVGHHQAPYPLEGQYARAALAAHPQGTHPARHQDDKSLRHDPRGR